MFDRSRGKNHQRESRAVFKLLLFLNEFFLVFRQPKTLSVPKTFLFVSTLDGTLYAVHKNTGEIRWSIKEGKYLKSTRIMTHFKEYHKSLSSNCRERAVYFSYKLLIWEFTILQLKIQRPNVIKQEKDSNESPKVIVLSYITNILSIIKIIQQHVCAYFTLKITLKHTVSLPKPSLIGFDFSSFDT